MTLLDLQEGCTVPCDGSTGGDGPPAWLDEQRFRRGQGFFQRHLMACTLAMHCSLVVGFSMMNLLEALVFTRRSDTPAKAIYRYLDTFLHIILWHTGNVWGGPTDPASRSMDSVRRMHFQVAKAMASSTEEKGLADNNGGSTKGTGLKQRKGQQLKDHGIEGVHWTNTEKYGEPTNKGRRNGGDKRAEKQQPVPVYLSQYDMALVQVGFMGAITMYPRGFGVVASKTELEDYIYFWRAIGHRLGIQDEYNVCSAVDYETTTALCKEIEEHVLLPGLRNPPEGFIPMAEAYCNGVNGLLNVPYYSVKAIIAFVLDGMGRPRLTSLGFADRLRVVLYKLYVVLIRWLPGFEQFVNRRTMIVFQMMSKLSEDERRRRRRPLIERLEKEAAARKTS